MRLRPHQNRVKNIPSVIRKQSRKLYKDFPDTGACWEQSPAHIKHFIDHLKCPEIERYHLRVRACKPFDDFVANWANSDDYRITFFTYYEIVGVKPAKKVYTEGLVTSSQEINRLAEMDIRKKRRDQIEGVPPLYESWPVHFNLPLENRDDLLAAIEACIERRLQFRNACIRDCCTRLDTGSHDIFLLILQILRAVILVYR